MLMWESRTRICEPPRCAPRMAGGGTARGGVIWTFGGRGRGGVWDLYNHKIFWMDAEIRDVRWELGPSLASRLAASKSITIGPVERMTLP